MKHYTMENKRALTFDEACIYSGISKSYMYKLTSAGIIPFSKPNGKMIWFDKQKLDHWLLSNASAGNQKEAAAGYVAAH